MEEAFCSNAPLSAKWRFEMTKSSFFSGNLTLSANSNWLAEGGVVRREDALHPRFFGLRQLFPLAEGVVLSIEATLGLQTSARS